MTKRNEKLGRLRLGTLDSIGKAAYEREVANALAEMRANVDERERLRVRAARKAKTRAARLRRLGLEPDSSEDGDFQGSPETLPIQRGTVECARCRRVLVFTAGAVCDSCYDRHGPAV